MSSAYVQSCLLMAAFLLSSFPANGGAPGTISGIVRDAGYKPIANATVTLGSDQEPKDDLQTTTNPDGAYRFEGLVAGEYHVSARKTGYVAAKPSAVLISVDKPNVSLDFILTVISTNAGDVPTTQDRAPPKFESAGVRGLVDPGGYSAPANAAAASGLIKGMADIKRADTENLGPVATALPCSKGVELTKSAEANPNSAEANRQLGEFYLAHGQATRAIPFLKRATQVDPKDSSAIEDLVIASLQTEQFDEARRLLAGLSEGELRQIHELLARAEEGAGRFRQASAEYKLAATQDPNEDNLFGVGYELILAGSSSDAAQAFQFARKRYPRSVTLLIGSGVAEFLQGNTPQARQYLLQAADLDPADPRPYPFLAALPASSTDNEKVRASLKRFLDLKPNDPQASYFYALTLWNARAAGDSSDLNTIESLLKHSIELDPNFVTAHFQLANLYFERSAFPRAVQEFENVLRLDPGMKDVQYRLASAYRQTGQLEQSAEELELFQKSKEVEAAQAGGTSISIEQFISVIAPKGRQASQASPCPEVVP
jgi:tetratricopeptide (TPR) repeat protein